MSNIETDIKQNGNMSIPVNLFSTEYSLEDHPAITEDISKLDVSDRIKSNNRLISMVFTYTIIISAFWLILDNFLVGDIVYILFGLDMSFYLNPVFMICYALFILIVCYLYTVINEPISQLRAYKREGNLYRALHNRYRNAYLNIGGTVSIKEFEDIGLIKDRNNIHTFAGKAKCKDEGSIHFGIRRDNLELELSNACSYYGDGDSSYNNFIGVLGKIKLNTTINDSILMVTKNTNVISRKTTIGNWDFEDKYPVEFTSENTQFNKEFVLRNDDESLNPVFDNSLIELMLSIKKSYEHFGVVVKGNTVYLAVRKETPLFPYTLDNQSEIEKLDTFVKTLVLLKEDIEENFTKE